MKVCANRLANKNQVKLIYCIYKQSEVQEI